MSARLKLSFSCLLIWLSASLLQATPLLPVERLARPWVDPQGLGLTIQLGFTEFDGLAETSFLAATWKGFGFGLAREQDDLRWRLSGGLGLGDEFYLGLGLDIKSLPEESDLTADLGLSWALSDWLLAEIGAQTFVLSQSAGGRYTPRYRFGFVLGAADDWFRLEPWLTFPVDERSLEFGLGLSLIPFSGLRIDTSWSYQDNEHRVLAGIGFGFGGFLASGRAKFSQAAPSLGVDIVVGDHGTGSLFGDRPYCLEIRVAGAHLETGRVGSLIPQTPAESGFVKQLAAIRRAGESSEVKAVLLFIRENGLGWARSEELLETLKVFRVRGIPVIACLEKADLKALLISSLANEIHIHESAQVKTTGPGMLVTYYTGLLEKLGLKASLLYKSEYKTAAQTVTEHSLTPAHRESALRVIDLIRRRAVELIAVNRNLSVERVFDWLKLGLLNPREAVREGIADGNLSRDAVVSKLLAQGFQLVSPQAWLEPRTGFKSAARIALITVEGSIVNGKSQAFGLPFGENTAGADTVVDALKRAGADSRIKAVLVRVQSGGGDIMASERIREALAQVSGYKPAAVSYGDLAASGGYYLSCRSDSRGHKTFSGGFSLTGSIGVIAGKLVTRDLRETIGLTSHRLGDTNAHIYGDEEDFSPDEYRQVSRMLDYWYEEFKKIVGKARGMNPEEVETLARGRVWLGEDALASGLVDDLGGASQALNYLAERIRTPLTDCAIIEFNQGSSGLAGALPLGQELQQLLEADAWPGMIFSSRPLAILPWTCEFN